MKKYLIGSFYLIIVILTVLLIYLLFNSYRIPLPRSNYIKTNDICQNYYEFDVNESVVFKNNYQDLVLEDYLIKNYDVDYTNRIISEFVSPTVELGTKDENIITSDCYGRILSFDGGCMQVLDYQSIIFRCDVDAKTYKYINYDDWFNCLIDNNLVEIKITNMAQDFYKGTYSLSFKINSNSINEDLYIFSNSSIKMILSSNAKDCYSISLNVRNYISISENGEFEAYVLSEDSVISKKIINVGMIGENAIEIYYDGISNTDKIGIKNDKS